jgi:hypothetical protein
MHVMRRELACAVLTALIVLLPGGGTALAERYLSISPAGSVTASSLGKLTFTAGTTTISCNVTMRGTLEEVVIETAGDHVGSVSEVTWATCTGGELERVLGLPWSLGYSSILGTMPNGLTGELYTINEAGMRFSILSGFVRCLYKGNVGALVALSGTNPYRTGLITLLGTELSRIEGGESCPVTGRLSGTLALSPAQEVTAAEQPPTYVTIPAEASEANHRIRFGRIPVNTTATIEYEIQATQGAFRFGNCILNDATHFNFEPNNSACGRAIDAPNTRRVRLRFTAGAVAGQNYSTTFTLSPIGAVTLSGET